MKIYIYKQTGDDKAWCTFNSLDHLSEGYEK